MSKIQDLSKFSTKELKEFLMSFDTVMSDIDGVVSYHTIPIEGARESLKKLNELGKQVYLITNNSTYTAEDYHKMLDMHPNNIIDPMQVIIWYLKKINFQGEIVAIVSTIAWNVLAEAGLQLVQPRIFPDKDKSNYRKEIINDVLDRPSVKAVIIDFDTDCNWSKCALAISCLERPGPFVRLINTQTGRVPLMCGKPSETLKNYVMDTCNVTDPRRCLFIGDSLDHDMKFALMCGFTKLLVGTGMNSLEEVQEKDDVCPDYYIPSLGQLFAAYKD